MTARQVVKFKKAFPEYLKMSEIEVVVCSRGLKEEKTPVNRIGYTNKRKKYDNR